MIAYKKKKKKQPQAAATTVEEILFKDKKIVRQRDRHIEKKSKRKLHSFPMNLVSVLMSLLD